MTKTQITNTQIALVSVLATGALILSACSSSDTATTQSQPTTSATPESAPGTVSVVATTTILGDVANNIVACAGGTVEVLMPIGADAHDFSASSDQVASMINADLVISNGLDLESGLIDSLENAANDGANVFEIAPLINPIEFGAGMHDEEGDAHSDEEGDAHDHGDLDPHFWFDMNRMADAAQLMGAELTQITGDLAYTTCADTTATQIQAAESDVREILESVPVENRILVTDHDALGYLADLYGYEIAGTVIPAGTTLASPSSADLAELVATIDAEGVTAIFANTAEPSALAEAVATETGADISVIPLYVGSLGAPDSPAATYIDMMRTDAQLIAQGLQG
ncbi:MAG: zinc ABC transporter substrate-binding protein [Actinomycetales bacterium]|jgi:zinc/manganese transport system substrate-binding protein|nr:zinc ABC transporter substrate-binding protein [Actinomycetales bacterium]